MTWAEIAFWIALPSIIGLVVIATVWGLAQLFPPGPPGKGK